jgi:hypothetical protein
MNSPTRLSFIALLVAVLPSTAADIRTINNRSVDLQPIHDWRSANGPPEARPMKHWKELQVIEIQQTISGTMHIIKAEADGVVQIITLRNMPKDLSAKLLRLQGLNAHVKEAERGAAVAKATAKASKMRVSGGIYVSGDDEYLNSVITEEQRRANQAAAATLRAELATASLDSLRDEIVKLTAEVKATKVLAMPTGGTYAGKAEWDTGLK